MRQLLKWNSVLLNIWWYKVGCPKLTETKSVVEYVGMTQILVPPQKLVHGPYLVIIYCVFAKRFNFDKTRIQISANLIFPIGACLFDMVW